MIIDTNFFLPLDISWELLVSSVDATNSFDDFFSVVDFLLLMLVFLINESDTFFWASSDDSGK